MNVQGAVIDEALLVGFQPDPGPDFDAQAVTASVDEVMELLNNAERPLVVAGHGIRISKGEDVFQECMDRFQIPIVSTFNGFDLIPSRHPLFVGRIGTIGDRAGNFALQNADTILFLGTRNNIRQVSYGWGSVGRAATKVVVDIDAAELHKPTLVADMKIHGDVKFFLECLLEKLGRATPHDHGAWLAWCRERSRRYPTVLPEDSYPERPVHPYLFARTLSEALPEDALVVTSNATANIVYFQGAVVKKGQRVIWNSGCASMGYDLPASIGACIACKGERVICLAGDGSIMMNLQELTTIAHNRLPVVIFVFNNRGYVSIRQTQSNFFGKLYGCDEHSGVGFTDIMAIASAFGLQTARIEGNAGMRERIGELLAMPGPVLCEVILDPAHTIEPKLSSVRLPDGRMVSKPLEDMSPLLDRDEFCSNMIIDDFEDK
jgi:acetolactate synthase-1/2/3 large subunit